jgi:hypothetical protein
MGSCCSYSGPPLCGRVYPSPWLFRGGLRVGVSILYSIENFDLSFIGWITTSLTLSELASSVSDLKLVLENVSLFFLISWSCFLSQSSYSNSPQQNESLFCLNLAAVALKPWWLSPAPSWSMNLKTTLLCPCPLVISTSSDLFKLTGTAMSYPDSPTLYWRLCFRSFFLKVKFLRPLPRWFSLFNLVLTARFAKAAPWSPSSGTFMDGNRAGSSVNPSSISV